MKFIFGVLLLTFAVFLNSIEKSSQSGEEPPSLSRRKWRLSIGFKGFPNHPGSSEPEKNNENPHQNRSRGPTRQENLPLARKNENLSEGQHSAKPRSQFPIHSGSPESGSVNSQLRRENENYRQYRPKGQTVPKNLPLVRENENHPEEYEHPPEKFQHPEKILSKSKGSSKPKVSPRDPGDPDNPGVVFWLPHD